MANEFFAAKAFAVHLDEKQKKLTHRISFFGLNNSGQLEGVTNAQSKGTSEDIVRTVE